jgi:hypothetical protein
MIFRNDDISVDTEIEDIKWFCKLCDRYRIKALLCITPLGDTHGIDVKMTNDEIKGLSNRNVTDNDELISYLQNRNDLIAVHGLWHTHEPTEEEIDKAKLILDNMGLKPTYFVPPFNEGDYPEDICGLKVSAKTQRLEDYLEEGTPTDEIVYLHSWRFGDDKWYKREQLELCLKRLKNSQN